MKTAAFLNVPFVGIIILSFLSCTDQTTPDRDPGPEPEMVLKADFNYTVNGDCFTPVLEIVFQNSSENSSSYFWDFGDGSFADVPNPKKIYPKAGRYNVSLKASSNNKSETISKMITMVKNSDGKGPITEFAYSSAAHKLEVTFQNKSQYATSYIWSFGDGTLETATINPVHTYAGFQTYTVTLIASNAEGSNCYSVNIFFD